MPTVKRQKWLCQTHSSCTQRKWPEVRKLTSPIVVLMWAVMSDDPEAMEKVKLFFEYFQSLPSWFTNLWILVVASIFGIKGTQIFRGGKK
jgi:hypothetical protein